MKLVLFPKIDLLVADHILGYELVRLGYLTRYVDNPSLKDIRELREAARRRPVAVPKGAWDDPPSESASIFKIADGTIAPAPKFSLDLLLTFNAIVPQINREGLLFSMKQNLVAPHILWEVTFGEHSFMSRIPSMAICIAALKVADIDFNEEGINLAELQ